MPGVWQRFVEQDLLPYWSLAVLLAVLLVLALRWALPKDDRRRIRPPAVLVIASVGLFGMGLLLPKPELDPRTAQQVAAEILEEGDADDAAEALRTAQRELRTQRDVRVIADRVHSAINLAALACLLFAIGRSAYLLLLHLALDRKRKRAAGDRPLPAIFRDIIQVGIYAIVVIALLNQAGVELGSLLTTSALLSVVIGLALQDTLANLFAGLAIQTQQPFEVGDWIQFDDDPDHIGEVLEINWRATRIQTNDRVEVIVPNGTLAKAPIRNYSKPTPMARRSVTVFAPQDAPPARIHRLLLASLAQIEGIRTTPAPDCQTLAFSERGIEYRVRYFIETFGEREPIDSRVRDRLWYALRRAALPIPAPHRRVTIVEQSAETHERDAHARIADVEHALGHIPLFRPLPPELLHELALHSERRLYAPGEIVIQQGELGSELFVVERGRVEVLVNHKKKLERVATLGPRDFFGEMGLLTGEQRRATIRADGELALLVVGKDALQPILEAAPDLVTEISQVLAAREIELGRHDDRDDSSEGDAGVSVEERRGVLLSRIRQFFSI